MPFTGVGSTDVLGLVVSLVLLATVLLAAVIKLPRLPESVVAVGAAVVVLATGLVSSGQARDELGRLAPVLVFLAAVLVLGACSAHEGVFVAVGAWLARSHDRTGGLLVWVFVVAAVVTSVLSLDATVVLLTPVVLSAAGRLRISPRPYVYATGHVANSGSLLLPTGNLTNLLALSAAGLTLVHFAALMLMPWLLVLSVEYVVMRVYFRGDLSRPPARLARKEVVVPWFALTVLGLTLVGFVVTSVVGIAAYWAAVGGAAVLAGHTVGTRRTSVVAAARAVDAPFLLFVMGLAVVVRAAVENGLGEATARWVPGSDSLLSLLAMAGVAAILANVVNNLPALLILLPAVSAIGPIAVLAVLIGVNVGPNLTYPGSLATLLWRQVLHDHGLVPSLRRFTVLGILTVPASIAVGVVGLWAGGQVLP